MTTCLCSLILVRVEQWLGLSPQGSSDNSLGWVLYSTFLHLPFSNISSMDYFKYQCLLNPPGSSLWERGNSTKCLLTSIPNEKQGGMMNRKRNLKKSLQLMVSCGTKKNCLLEQYYFVHKEPVLDVSLAKAILTTSSSLNEWQRN